MSRCGRSSTTCSRCSGSVAASPGTTSRARSSRPRTAARRSTSPSCRAWSRSSSSPAQETTVSLIGNAVLALIRNPEQRALLEGRPELLAQAVEELVRYDGPVERTLTRWASRDVELRGQEIRQGDLVIVVLGAADRDPDRFAAPDTLDVTAERDVKHVGFGRGSHYCLGAPLARLEAEVALATLFRRLPGLRLAVPEGELAWRPVPLFRSLAALPLAWDAR